MLRIDPIIRLIAVLLIIVAAAESSHGVNPTRPALIPSPQKIEWSDRAIKLRHVRVILPAADQLQDRLTEERLQKMIKSMGISHDPSSRTRLVLKLGEVPTPGHWQGQGKEAYLLETSAQELHITANEYAGLFYGLQTLRQLIVRENGETTVAVCKIHDYPAFKIRGLMHDVGRNFQSLEQLKMQIDVLAAYKMNVFHFHLTEYHGWRLESKVFPKLQADSSFTRKPGKYYTQKEFADFVDYCWERGITVIPEFDSPGHSDAFRKGVGVETMSDPKAKEAMVLLINEICSLVSKEKMPYFHVGTDEVGHAEERVGNDYLPAVHAAVHDNGREVIGWWKGMHLKDDKRQILQTWAQSKPITGMRNIDSRANYLNHLEALDFLPRMMFQQPCRRPHGDAYHLGGILCHWPDNRVDDEKLTLTNNPVLPAVVAYSEAVWKGIKKDRPEFWAKVPPKGSAEYKAFADFENRLAEHRDRFFSGKPFPYVKSQHIEWRLLGPVADGEVEDLERGIIKDIYRPDNRVYRWTKPIRGGAIHVKHFFGFPGHLKTFAKGKDVVWANTFIHSDRDREISAWISFNTTSSSDNRAGVAKQGDWNANSLCNIWINDRRIDPPKWKNPGKMGKEFAFTDEIYTSRPTTKIHLKKGWNKVLIKTASSWKWCFSFAPVYTSKGLVEDVQGLHFSSSKRHPGK